jgi:RNase P subunit RPR2
MIKMDTASSYDLKSFSKEIIEHSSAITANFIHLRKNYLSKYCAGCHGSQWNEGNLSNRSQVSNDFYTFVFSSGFTMPGNSAQSHAIRAIKRSIRPMPPLDPTLRQAALNNLAPLETFIDKDLAKIRRVAVPVLNVRKEPKGRKCNITIKENTPFYIVKSKRINTTEWAQIIVPSDIKRTFTQKCQQTEFWIAISGKYSKPF